MLARNRTDLFRPTIYKAYYNVRGFVQLFSPISTLRSAVHLYSLNCEAVLQRCSARTTPYSHTTYLSEKMLMLKNVVLCLHTVCERVHVRHGPYVILMQQHGMQHPCPQEAQYTAFVCTPCKVALQCQLDGEV